MADEAFRGPGEIVEANAETNLLDNLVGILGVDVVLDGLDALLVEVLGGDLDQVREFCLQMNVLVCVVQIWALLARETTYQYEHIDLDAAAPY